MTLLERTRQTASRANRLRQQRAERRMDEIVVVAEVHAKYEKADRDGDLRVESLIQKVHDLADDEEEREAAAQLLAAWWASERQEGIAVEGAVRDAVDHLRRNNGFWLADGCGPDGRAA